MNVERVSIFAFDACELVLPRMDLEVVSIFAFDTNQPSCLGIREKSIISFAVGRTAVFMIYPVFINPIFVNPVLVHPIMVG